MLDQMTPPPIDAVAEVSLQSDTTDRDVRSPESAGSRPSAEDFERFYRPSAEDYERFYDAARQVVAPELARCWADIALVMKERDEAVRRADLLAAELAEAKTALQASSASVKEEWDSRMEAMPSEPDIFVYQPAHTVGQTELPHRIVPAQSAGPVRKSTHWTRLRPPQG